MPQGQILTDRPTQSNGLIDWKQHTLANPLNLSLQPGHSQHCEVLPTPTWQAGFKNPAGSSFHPSSQPLQHYSTSTEEMLSRGGLGVLYVTGGLVNLLTFGVFDLPQVIFDPNDSAVRVAVALDGGVDLPAPNDGPTEADEDFPTILAFNELGGYIGSSWTHEKIPSGGFNEVIVDQAKGPGQQATYLQFFARKDAVCIAYISQQWADGQTRGWLGDMGICVW